MDIVLLRLALVVAELRRRSMVDRRRARQCRLDRQSSPCRLRPRMRAYQSRRCGRCCETALVQMTVPSNAAMLTALSGLAPCTISVSQLGVGQRTACGARRSWSPSVVSLLSSGMRYRRKPLPPWRDIAAADRSHSFYAAQLLSVSFGAIFGSAWINLPNGLPQSAGVSTKIMVTYFIMWLIQVPFAFIQ